MLCVWWNVEYFSRYSVYYYVLVLVIVLVFVFGPNVLAFVLGLQVLVLVFVLGPKVLLLEQSVLDNNTGIARGGPVGGMTSRTVKIICLHVLIYYRMGRKVYLTLDNKLCSSDDTCYDVGRYTLVLAAVFSTDSLQSQVSVFNPHSCTSRWQCTVCL